MKKIISLTVLSLFLFSCVSPKVINVIGPNDNKLSCEELSKEITIANRYADEAQEAKKMDHMNTYRKIAGRLEWQDVTCTLYDPIVPSGAQAVMEWVRLHYESVTGRAGYSDFYKKDVTFNVLGPVGDIVEEWQLVGTYISEANFGTLDWATNDPVDIELTLRYDYAILQF